LFFIDCLCFGAQRGNCLPAPVSPQQMFGLGIQIAEQTLMWCAGVCFL
jgi:hypothetical protein